MTIEEQIMKLQTYKMYEGEDTVYVERDDVLKLLEQQPKMGKWIDVDSLDGALWHECSECSQCHTWFGHDCYEKTSYCPNCGAEMSGGGEDDD